MSSETTIFDVKNITTIRANHGDFSTITFSVTCAGGQTHDFKMFCALDCYPELNIQKVQSYD